MIYYLPKTNFRTIHCNQTIFGPYPRVSGLYEYGNTNYQDLYEYENTNYCIIRFQLSDLSWSRNVPYQTYNLSCINFRESLSMIKWCYYSKGIRILKFQDLFIHYIRLLQSYSVMYQINYDDIKNSLSLISHEIYRILRILSYNNFILKFIEECR